MVRSRQKRRHILLKKKLGDKTHKCTIAGCSKRLVGTKNHNLVAHIKSQHEEIYSKFINPKHNENYYKILRLKFIQSCCEIIAINGRPFSSLDDSGFTKIIQEKMDELNNAGYGVKLRTNDYAEIKNYIYSLAEKINNHIKLELKDQYFSLMLDIAKKNDKSFLGISAQYLLNGSIKIRSIGMCEITQAHTARHIKEILIGCLAKFDLTIRRVISITTDNGANLLAMVNLLNEEDFAVLNNDDDDDDSSEVEGPETRQQGTNTLTQNDVGTSEDVHSKAMLISLL